MTASTDRPWPFADLPATVAVTTRKVTEVGMPILYVSHDRDEDGGATWQFHSLIEPVSMDEAQLVRLDTIMQLDPSVAEVADLPVGYAATRVAPGSEWRRYREE